MSYGGLNVEFNFALQFVKSKVEKEFQSLVDADILYPVNSSEYGSLILCFIKEDGSIRIYGDFKVTINPQSEIDCFSP